MAPNHSIADSTALITGASQGIGAATARAFAAAGANVAVLARRREPLETVVEDLEAVNDINAVAVLADITDDAAVQRAVEQAKDALGGIDILVNNAGIGGVDYARFEEASACAIHNVIETNLTGAILVTRAALPSIRERQGNIIFVGSSAAMRPRPGSAVYAASKWGLRGFAQSLEAHAGADGVAVTSIHTSLVRTDRWADVPPGGGAEPDEIAEAILYAATQPSHTTVSELTLHRRDILGKFVPPTIDLEPGFDPPEQ